METQKELSYFYLSLLAYLRESHPHLSDDLNFTQSRAELAEEAFEQALLNGHSQTQAIEVANDALYHNLHFSLHDTIVNILWSEFANQVPQGDAERVAMELYPHLKEVAERYTIDDNFDSTPKYNDLYTELTGAILIHFERYGI